MGKWVVCTTAHEAFEFNNEVEALAFQRETPGAFHLYKKVLTPMWQRREWARKSRPLCPECETEQVQLTDWRTDNLKFKCRKCHLQFEMVCE